MFVCPSLCLSNKFPLTTELIRLAIQKIKDKESKKEYKNNMYKNCTSCLLIVIIISNVQTIRSTY